MFSTANTGPRTALIWILGVSLIAVSLLLATGLWLWWRQIPPLQPPPRNGDPRPVRARRTAKNASPYPHSIFSLKNEPEGGSEAIRRKGILT